MEIRQQINYIMLVIRSLFIAICVLTMRGGNLTQFTDD